MEIGRGAEAVITLEEGAVRKWRIPKGYRLPELDEQIRRERTIREARITSEARRCGVPTPIIKDVLKFDLIMEHVGGQKLKDVITPALSEQVGEMVGRLHKAGIIHGDLTTSNMILRDGTNLPDRLRPGISRRIGRGPGRGRPCLLPDAGVYSRQTGGADRGFPVRVRKDSTGGGSRPQKSERDQSPRKVSLI